MARDRVQVAEVLAVEASENVITVLSAVRHEADGGKHGRELAHRDNSARRVSTDDALLRVEAEHRCVRLGSHEVKNLPVSIEEEHAELHHVLEDEVLVVVALLQNVRVDDIVDSQLPLAQLIIEALEVVDFLLRDVSVQDLLVDAAPQRRRNASLSVLHEVRLIVFRKEALADDYAVFNEGLLLVEADLTQSHVQLMELLAQLLQCARLQLQLDFAPQQIGIAREVAVTDSRDLLVEHAGLVDGFVLEVGWRFRRGHRGRLRDADVLEVSAGAARRVIIVVTVCLGGLFFFHLLLQLLGSHVRLATRSNCRQQLGLECVVPLASGLGHVLQRLVIAVEEELRQLRHVPAVLELGRRDLARLLEEAVFVEDLVHLVLDLGLELQIPEEARNQLGDFMRLQVLRANNLVLDRFLDGPEDVAVLDFLEYQLTLLVVRQVEVGAGPGSAKRLPYYHVVVSLIHILNYNLKPQRADIAAVNDEMVFF